MLTAAVWTWRIALAFALILSIGAWARSHRAFDIIRAGYAVPIGRSRTAPTGWQWEMRSADGRVSFGVASPSGRDTPDSSPFEGGTFHVEATAYPTTPPFHFGSLGPLWRFGRVEYYAARVPSPGFRWFDLRAILLPYWMVVAALVLAHARWVTSTLRAWRRSWHGWCVGCGYDLCASPGRCPECGVLSPSLRPRAA
jgi:hypothetical protein